MVDVADHHKVVRVDQHVVPYEGVGVAVWQHITSQPLRRKITKVAAVNNPSTLNK